MLFFLLIILIQSFVFIIDTWYLDSDLKFFPCAHACILQPNFKVKITQSACIRWPNVGPTKLTLLAQRCKPTLALGISANRAYVAPSCWLYVGPTVGPIVGLHWHGWANHWPNVGPTCRHIKGPMMSNFVNNILFLFSNVHMSWTMWIFCLLRQIKPDFNSDLVCHLNDFGINLTVTLSCTFYISTDLYQLFSLERNYKQLQPCDIENINGKMLLLFIQIQIYTINILNIFYISNLLSKDNY